MSMFNRRPATAAPDSSAAALPAGFDDETSSRFIPEPLREPWQRFAAGARIDRAARAEVVDELARQELREQLREHFPVLNQWEQYLERSDPDDRPRTPDEVYVARERMAELVREAVGDYVEEHEDALRQRATHLLTLEHVAKMHVQAEAARVAVEERHARYLCPACGVSDDRLGTPQRWSLLTGAPASPEFSRHPIVGPCCIKCAQLAHFDYLLMLQAEPIVGRGGEPDRLESRAMIAKRLRVEAVGER